VQPEKQEQSSPCVDPCLVDHAGCSTVWVEMVYASMHSDRFHVCLCSLRHVGLEDAVKEDDDMVEACGRWIGPVPGDQVRLIGGVVQVSDAGRCNRRGRSSGHGTVDPGLVDEPVAPTVWVERVYASKHSAQWRCMPGLFVTLA